MHYYSLLLANTNTMRLREKLRVLREVEGTCRGLPRALSKAEVVKLIREEAEERISLPYLSQLEGGTRTHMTNKTRLLLARFFRSGGAAMLKMMGRSPVQGPQADRRS